MPIYEITETKLKILEATSFHNESIKERQDLQRLIKQDISVISDKLFVITEEFGDWEDSRRRIDLLCIDSDANLVVVELKRTENGGYMELQAIRYAAMVSNMTFDEVVDTHARYSSVSKEDAEQKILAFLKWNTASDNEFGTQTKIILASANFSKELTTSVIWLNNNGLDVKCFRMIPYKTSDGRLMLDVQQIIPIPEATEYQTQIRAKQQAEKKRDSERYDLRYKFWTELLNYARTVTDLHANRKPGIYNWIGGGIGRTGFGLNYVVRELNCQIELYIDIKQDETKNLEMLKALEARKTDIERTFGKQLNWEELEDSRACRISYQMPGGYRSPQNEWPTIHKTMVEAMMNLDRAMRPEVKKLTV